MIKTAIALVVFSISFSNQKLEECGVDNNPTLTHVESEFLNEFSNDFEEKEFDFSNKKVVFITGSSGSSIGTKIEYFNHVKKWNQNCGKIATFAIELTQKEKFDSGGYDYIVTYWVKFLSKKKKQKLIQKLKIE